MIASFYDGRVRIRHSALKDPENLKMFKDAVSGQEGIENIAANPRTGSLLITYDPEKISRDMLLDAAAALQEHLGAAAKTAKKRRLSMPGRKSEITALTGLYGLTVLGGFVDKRLHTASGLLFTLLVAKHLCDRRRCL
jgi:hypothetical protein